MRRITLGAVTALFIVLFAWRAEVVPAPPKGKTVVRYLITADPKQLSSLGLRHEKVTDALGLVSADQKILGQIQASGIPHRIQEIGKVPIPDAFLDPKEIEDELKRLATQFSDRAEFVDLNQRYSTPLTAGKRRLFALRIRHPIKDPNPRPVVVLDSLHHSRELITPMVTVDAARQLVEKYGKDAQITNWLKYYEIWIVPMVNPDGYHYVFDEEPFWRKNRRANKDGSFGVDLNRNYPFMWGKCGKNSAVGSSEVYKGSGPASEPEIQTMVALGKALRPALYLSYHSFGNEIIRPYVCATMAEETLTNQVTRELAAAAGYRFRVASSSGESFEHFYALYGSLSFLVEVGTAFHPKVETIPSLLSQASKTWRAFLKRGMGSALRGTVLNRQGKAVQASLSLDEVPFKSGEIRSSHKRDGSFFWVVPAGEYTFRVKAQGYREWSKKISIPKDRALAVTVLLGDAPPDSPEPSPDASQPEPRPEPKAEKSTTPEPRPEPPKAEKKPTPDQKTPEPSLGPEPPAKGSCSCGTGGDLPVWVGLWLLALAAMGFRRSVSRQKS